VRRPALIAAVAIVTAAVVAAPAGATSTRDALIRPGIGIGKLRLGMTLAQARAALTQPLLLTKQRRFGGFQRYKWFTEFRTRDAEWIVSFYGERGRERVVRIATAVRRERTSTGVGVGTLVSELPNKLRSLKPTCRKYAPWLNWQSSKPQLTVCAIEGPTVTTVFAGQARCAVTPARYQGCPRVIVRVGSVRVEETALLRRLRLNHWRG
jgi:hypothetical protein